MTQNFPSSEKDINLQIQEYEKTLNRMNVRKTMPSFIKIKSLKIKDVEKKKTLQVAREEKHTAYRTIIQITVGFSSETLKPRKVSIHF